MSELSADALADAIVLAQEIACGEAAGDYVEFRRWLEGHQVSGSANAEHMYSAAERALPDGTIIAVCPDGDDLVVCFDADEYHIRVGIHQMMPDIMIESAQEDEDNYLVLTHRRYALVPRHSYADGDTGQRDDWYDVVEYATYADGAVERHVLDTLLGDVAESMIAHIRRAAPEF